MGETTESKTGRRGRSMKPPTPRSAHDAILRLPFVERKWMLHSGRWCSMYVQVPKCLRVRGELEQAA